MTASISLTACPKCQTPLSSSVWNAVEPMECLSCGTSFQMLVFHAFLHKAEVHPAAEVMAENEEAGCFYHPQKKAAISCDGCGVFLCVLCDIELDHRHLCPRCLQQGKKKGKLQKLENQRTLYDDIALSLSLLPLLMWPVTLITAPAALFIAIRYWKAPSSIIPRGRFRMIIAILFSVLQIAGWTALFIYLVTRFER